MQTADLARHIELIYDSACSPLGLQPMLEQLISDIGCRSGAIAIERHHHDHIELLSRHSCGYTEDETRIIVEHVHKIDEWTRSLWNFTPNQFHLSEILCPQNTLRNTEFYNVFCKKFGVTNATGCILQTDNNTALRIAFQNASYKARKFSKQIDYLNQLSPHLARAAGIRQNLLEMNASLESATCIVDSLPLAAILLDENCILHYLNAQAEELFRSHGKIEVKNGKVILRDPQANAFARQVNNTILNGQGNIAPPAPYAVLINGNTETSSLELSIHPVTTAQPCFGMNLRKTLALVYLKNPDTNVSIDTVYLKEVLGLTPKEQDLVCLLSQGLKLKQICALRHKSMNTLKSQLNSVFLKTNTSSQSQLLLQLTSSLATVVKPTS